MRVYVAARFQDIGLAREAAQWLRTAGHDVVSTWHDIENPEMVTEKALQRADRVAFSRQRILRDLAEIEESDALILLAAAAGEPSSGGRHVEFGYAFSRDRRCVVVGEPENLFHFLPGVSVVPGVAEAAVLLGGGAVC